MNTLESALALPSHPIARSTLSVYRPARATNANRVFNLQNAEKGIVLRVGEQFALDLGQGRWSVRVRDEMVLGADGVQFQALAAGKTRVVVTGDMLYANKSSPSHRKIFMEFPVTVLS